MWDIPVEDVPGAIMWEAIGQCFAVLGMAVAKWSLGLFLLRLVTQKWHKVSIWLVMGALMGASISVCFVFMLQCSPPAYLWDKSIKGGHCDLDATPVSMTLCSMLPTLPPQCFVQVLRFATGESVPRLQRADERESVLTTPKVLCVFADFFFALMPWIFLWKLNMNQREKMIIAISMSLGVM